MNLCHPASHTLLYHALHEEDSRPLPDPPKQRNLLNTTHSNTSACTSKPKLLTSPHTHKTKFAYSPRFLSLTVKYKQQQNAKARRVFFPLDTDRKAHPQFQKVGTLCKIEINTECKKGKCLFDVETHLRKDGYIRAHGISTLHIGKAPSILKDI